MKVIAKKNRELALINAQNTQNENKAETIELVVPEEYEDYNKKIVFITDDETVWDIITNNEYKITNAITKYKQVDFYIWLTKEVDGESIDFRTKTKTLNFYHNEDASDEITDEEIHGVNTVVNLLEEEIEKVENLNIEATKIGSTTTVTITKKDGTTESVEINDGVDGQDGQDGYTPQKGIDYFTEQDIEEIETDVKNDLEENVLVNYSLTAETGAKIELSINTTDYKLKAILKDKNNNIIHTSNVIDLPLETMVVNATYDNVNKAIILTLQNGTTVSISVADLVSGLVSESQLQTILSNYYTKTEINNLLNNKVDKIQGKELSTNDFTDTLKEKLERLENYDDTKIKADISDIQDEQVEQNTEIEKLQTENARLKATLPTTGEVTGQDITLNKTAEFEFIKPPLPRGNTKQDTTTGKNLLNTINANTTTINGVTSYRNNGFYYLSGTNTKTGAIWILPNTQNTNLPTFEIGQTYTMSFKGTLPSGIYAQLNAVKTSTGTQYSLGIVKNTVPSVTFTIDSDYSSTAQLFVGVQATATNVDCNFAIQIEKGSTATPYEPYTGGIPSPNPSYPQEVEVVTGNVEVTISNENNTESKTLSVSLGNIELCKIGNYQDYLYKNNGKWYKYNAINKLVLNGSENWTAHGSIASWFYWDGLTNGFTDSTISGYALSNYFTQKAYSTVTSLKNGEFAYGQVAGETRKRFVIKDTDYTTVADFKSWLSTHNTIVYYVLATPTDTEITDATLISQLEEISKTLSYQGQTNITSNTIALFDVEAYQSTKLVLQDFATAIVALGGV